METQEKINVEAFLQHVREQGFAIEDYGIVNGVRRFAIEGQERMIYFDIDRLLWDDFTHTHLLHQVDLALTTLKE